MELQLALKAIKVLHVHHARKEHGLGGVAPLRQGMIREAALREERHLVLYVSHLRVVLWAVGFALLKYLHG